MQGSVVQWRGSHVGSLHHCALWYLPVSEPCSVAIGQPRAIEPLLQLMQSPREVGG